MTRDLLIAQLKVHEGTGPIKNGRLMPYKDSVGKLSIGYGRNLDANGVRVVEATFMLDNDLDDAIRTCHEVLPFFEHLDTVRQAVVSELMFNMGWGTLKEFVNTLRAIERHDFVAAATGLRNSKWYQQVKRDRGERLAKQMETGQW